MQLLMGEKRKGHFWHLHYFLEWTQWTAPCGSGVPGILPGAAHGFRDKIGLISPPAIRPSKVGRVKCFEPCWWGGLPWAPPARSLGWGSWATPVHPVLHHPLRWKRPGCANDYILDFGRLREYSCTQNLRIPFISTRETVQNVGAA